MFYGGWHIISNGRNSISSSFVPLFTFLGRQALSQVFGAANSFSEEASLVRPGLLSDVVKGSDMSVLISFYVGAYIRAYNQFFTSAAFTSLMTVSEYEVFLHLQEIVSFNIKMRTEIV